MSFARCLVGEQKYVMNVNGMSIRLMFNQYTIINKCVKQMGLCNNISNHMHLVRTHAKKGKVILIQTVAGGLRGARLKRFGLSNSKD